MAAGGAAVVLAALVLGLTARESKARAGQAVAGAAVLETESSAGPIEGGGGTPPDISNMTPRERFDRLYNRVMKAAETGDQATQERFGPMALAAYRQLDPPDADARYHAALLMLHGGQVPGAGALADTILAADSTHLFGHLVRRSAARFRGDSAGVRQAEAAFLRHYDAELKRNREEYGAHRRTLESTRQELLGRRP